MAPQAPEGAPNVLYLVWDDTGIATWDCFGGLVDMPNMSRIAEAGVRLTQFHTTALCSPTRAALLTGRNPTNVGMATIEEFTEGFPNASGRIPAETALLSEVLAEHGWNTYAVGKWHLTPLEESNVAATKRHWPCARGFERFYGFMGGETDQWYPELVYDNHPVAPPATPEQGYHLSKDLADRTIEFIRDSKTIAPDKPWFTYLCPGAGHAPHHVFREWADRYAGRFDMGYERYREIVLENQKHMGLLPPETELSPMNPYAQVTGPNGQPWPALDTVRPWDSLSDDERRLFARMAEVFAGFLSYTDDQIGRVLDYLEESGQLDNTVIVVISDNGASGEGGPNGSVNEVKFFNGLPDTAAEGLRFADELGSPATYGHYPIGWAMAFNTPYKLFKRYASHEGGIADPAIISWPAGIGAAGELRDNYVNVADITPTIYELLGITAPVTVKGIPQRPLDGTSFAAALRHPDAPTGKQTQFYTMLGTRGIWHRGWFAGAVHAATPSGWGHFDDDRWELFHLDVDRSQCVDLAEEHPEKLAELRQLWFDEAARHNGLPLADLSIAEIYGRNRPGVAGQRERFVFYPGAEVGMGADPQLRGRSFSVLADVDLGAEPEGVLFKHGCGHGGYLLVVADRRLCFVYNFMGADEQWVRAESPLPTGRRVLGVRYERTGVMEGSHVPVGAVTLHVGDDVVGRAEGVRAHPGTFGLGAVSASVGRNSGQAVSAAVGAPAAFTGGTIERVIVDLSGTEYRDAAAELAAAFARD
ncbi:hypothetical protein MBRU_05445 [Mycolicibacterium brumae DSM 44177]|nr:hypothetical protein MBRU_05445 [Mycolicibacterium brumae DSM 44177]